MGRKRTPKTGDKIVCVLCNFGFPSVAGYTYHLCAVHTGLEDHDSRDDGGGYYYCSKCGNQKKRHRRGEFHAIKNKQNPSRKHSCLEQYIVDNTQVFWSCLVTVGVNVARRMAAKMYLKEENVVDQGYIDKWLPLGTYFGEAIPHVAEYHASNSKVTTQDSYGMDALLEYLGIPELDMIPAPEAVLRPNKGRGRGGAASQTPVVSPGGAQGQDDQLKQGAMALVSQGKAAGRSLQLGKDRAPGKTKTGVTHTESTGVGATPQKPGKPGIGDSDTKLGPEVVEGVGVSPQESCASRHLRLSKVPTLRQSSRLLKQRQKGSVVSPGKESPIDQTDSDEPDSDAGDDSYDPGRENAVDLSSEMSGSGDRMEKSGANSLKPKVLLLRMEACNVYGCKGKDSSDIEKSPITTSKSPAGQEGAVFQGQGEHYDEDPPPESQLLAVDVHSDPTTGTQGVGKRAYGSEDSTTSKTKTKKRHHKKSKKGSRGGLESNEGSQEGLDNVRSNTPPVDEWPGQGQYPQNSIRHSVSVHVIEGSKSALRVTNEKGIDCFRVSARVKASGALVIAETPCTTGSPSCIFRDCPELEPYVPPPVDHLPWVNTADFLSSASVLVTTLTRRTREEQQMLGIVHDAPSMD